MRVSTVSVETDGTLTEPQLRELLGFEPDDAFDYFKGREAVDRVRTHLAEEERLQSRVRLDREEQDHQVALTLQVDAGPVVELVYDSPIPAPDAVVKDLREQWRRGVFDVQRLDDAEDRLRGWLMRDRYFRATVHGRIEDAGPDRRRVRFAIDPGPRSESVTLAFEGASGVSPDVLAGIVDSQSLELQLFTDPIQVTELLERYYREEGYLVADLDTPRYEYDGTQARVVVPVDEGPRFTVRQLTVGGNSAIDKDTLIGELPLVEGDAFLPPVAERSLRRLRDLYWARGYNEVRPDYELAVDRDAGVVDVRFTLNEGRQSVVAGIDVEGTRQTTPDLVKAQVTLAPDEPLDLKALAESRSNLYDTRAFSLVDIEREEEEADGDAQKPVRLKVRVREVQPVQLRYGASFDTERGLGGIVDLSSHNMLGRARVLGVRGRYDSQVTDGRVYFSQPSLRSWPIETTASVYFREDRNPMTSRTGRFDVERLGASVQQQRRLGDSFLWNYGVRFERARSVDPLGGGLDERVTVAPIGSTFTRETRDEVLDATRGSFLSQAFQYSPAWLGSDQTFLKYFGQYFHYFPLQRVRRERLTNELIRPRLVFASGARLGLAWAPGGRLPVSERFFAGGSTTLRGFEQNLVGPIGVDGIPLGGQAMLVLNNELRFPLVSIVDGVAFVDVGGVFDRVTDFGISDLRESGGLGLRFRTPWFLGRVDYGFLFDRRTGEPRGRFYFSIGQAF
ncbi:MAG: BamA/TamA family outer membrane protein [Vicinamibacterales bacterium]